MTDWSLVLFYISDLLVYFTYTIILTIGKQLANHLFSIRRNKEQLDDIFLIYKMKIPTALLTSEVWCEVLKESDSFNNGRKWTVRLYLHLFLLFLLQSILVVVHSTRSSPSSSLLRPFPRFSCLAHCCSAFILWVSVGEEKVSRA